MRIFLMGATPSFDIVEGQSIDERLAKTGGNTGNQVIAYGLLKSLSYEDVCWDYGIGPRRVDEEYDLILIAAANFLFPGFDFGGMASFIEQTKLPVAVAGLGAQSNDYSPAIPLKPGTERLIKVLSERARSIGVRGPFTAEVLNHFGVHNVEVLGCPSFYMRGAAGFVVERSLATHPRVAINLSRDVVKHSFDASQASRLLESAIDYGIATGADFVSQTETLEMAIEVTPPGDERDAMIVRLRAALFGQGEGHEGFEAWAAGHLRTFWSVDDWCAAMRGYGLVFGQRFHGNMIALASGTPAVWIHHDSRTEEMCRLLGLPAISLAEASGLDLARISERFSLDTIQKNYPRLFETFLAFLRRNGLMPLADRPALHAAE